MKYEQVVVCEHCRAILSFNRFLDSWLCGDCRTEDVEFVFIDEDGNEIRCIRLS